jgi:hypothetical protein
MVANALKEIEAAIDALVTGARRSFQPDASERRIARAICDHDFWGGALTAGEAGEAACARLERALPDPRGAELPRGNSSECR